MKNYFLTLLSILILPGILQSQTPQLVVPTGHTRTVTTLELSPDGKYLFTNGEDGRAIIWEMRTGAQLKSLKGANPISAVAFSPDGKRYAVSYRGVKEANIKVFELQTERLLYSATQSGVAEQLFMTRDHKYLVAAGGDYRLTVFDAQTGKLLKQFGGSPQDGSKRLMLDDHAEFLVVSRDERFYAVGTSRKMIDVFDVTGASLQESGSGKPAYSIGQFENKVGAAKWSPDGKFLLFATTDSILFCWSAAERRGLWQSKQSPSSVNSAVWSADSSKFTMIQNDTLHEVDTRTGQLLSNTANKIAGETTWWVSLPEKDRYLKGVGATSMVMVDWKTKTELVAYRQKVDNGWNFSMAGDASTLVSFDSGTPQLWDLAAGKMRRLNVAPNAKFLIIDPKGQRIAGPGGMLDVKTNTNAPMFSFPGAGTVWSQDWSPDGRHFALGVYYKYPKDQYGNETLFLYEAATGKELINRKLKDETARAMAFSPDNRWLAVGLDEGKLEIYDVPSGNNFKTLKLPFDKTKLLNDIYAIAFSPDGKMLYASIGETIKAIQIPSWKVMESRFAKPEQTGWALSVSPDNKLLLEAGTKGLIHLYDAQSAQLLRTFRGHTQNIMEVRWLKGGKHFVSVGDDQSLRIWDKEAEREQLQLFGFVGSDDWVAVTPDGRFDGTTNGIKNLYFVRGIEVLPLESLYEKFYTPGLIKRVLSGEPLPPISDKDDIRNLKLPPLVKILPPIDSDTRNLTVEDDIAATRRFASKTGRIKLTVEATAQQDGVAEIRLFHNGKAVGAGTRNLVVEDEKIEAKKTQVFEIQLADGENFFRAIAINAQRTESRPDEMIVTNKATIAKTTITTTATLHLLVVGINTYKNSKYNLNYATADATAFKSAIESTSAGLYAKVNAVYIGDAQATKAGIVAELEKVKAAAQAADVFIFYYAGHGVLNEKKEFHLVPNDVTQLYGADEALAQKGISAKLMQQFSSEIKAQKQLFILDACQSAGALDNVVALRGVAEEKAIAQLARATGTHWLTASGSEQFAAEFKQLGHGTFTYVLLEALTGKADKGSDRKITVKELDAYLQEIVPEVTAKYRGAAQYPASYGFGNDFPIGVVK